MSPRIGLNFNELLKKSIEIVDNEGWEALTISYLAKKLTIQPPSIYNHIKNLDELKNKVAIYGITQLYDQLEASVKSKDKDEAIYSLAFAYIDFARNHPGLYQATLSSNHTLGNEYHSMGKKILELIFNVLNPFKLSEIDLIHTVRGLRSILHGFVSLESHEGFGINIPIHDSVLFTLKKFLQNSKMQS
ncbi:TetR/AcrR family transcriptional regulator [Bacillus sp. EAC]|uniref:TetR/AcrR family transcriptional regulator n=1 Tax=Bacillus sp. EAC TaxID=1978338 RepID=UPI000B44CA07|nr:TetR/AcrR family transcriptional regulator [Bacillus sp. EAC]